MISPQTRKIAETPHTVLITGRTGTGKTYLAQKIHEMSPRRASKFVSVNLATLSENLIESELFGHERGAFSGADSKRLGKLECGNGGTVFLDEIGELPPRLQVKLLEALNSHTISPVGSNREILLDIRIIAATNRDLSSMVREGKFREDLFFRLNTFEIRLDDLARTPERIPALAENFAESAARRQNKPARPLDPGLLRALSSYDWPGNIRELKNAVEFAVAMSAGSSVGAEALPPYVRERTLSASPAMEFLGRFPTDYRAAKQEFERIYLAEVLKRFQGKINLTAKRSGLSKVTLIEKIRRYEIDIPTIKYEAHLRSKEIHS
jgi:DNA-binding NtrC family response regulator